MMRAAGPFAFSLVALAACGGGAGSTGPQPPPAPAASPPPSAPPSAAPSPGRTATPAPSASPAPSILPSGTIASIGHVIIIFQENRTPDNLFHGLPGADIASAGLNTSSQTIALSPIPLANSYDLDHSHTGFLQMYDSGKMDGANTVGTSCGNACPYANPQYGYVPSSDNAPYMQMATQYAFADRMFQTNEGPSYPAHQYIFAGTSEPSVGSTLLVSENTKNPGCLPGEQSLVTAIDPAGSENHQIVSCFEHATLADLLDAKGISWRYYTPTTLGIWVAPNSIGHVQSGPDWANVVSPETTILSDVANAALPQVSWVIPSSAESDHAKSNNGTGPAWVASIVNAIGQSKYWNNTVIFVTWDDWGGWYDHVKPQVLGSYELGFRVPLIVISPYARAGYVSHVQHEFGSLLKFTEETFSTGSLGFTDVRADDLADCFNFQQPPSTFRTISSLYSADYFKRKPLDSRSPDTDF